MDSFPPRFLDQIASSLLANYFNVASLVVLTLEYFQTVGQEAKLIWPTQWSYVKVIFILNRYLPLALVPPIIYYNVAPLLPALTCKLLFTVPAIGIACSILVADALLYIRIYAVSGRSTIMRNILVANALCVFGLALGPWAFYLIKTVFIDSPFPELSGCFGSEPGPVYLVMVTFGSLLYSTIVTAALFVFYAVRLSRTSRANPLLKVLYIDGALYFISIAALSIINGLVAVLAPDRYRFLLAIPQAVFHNILAARMVLDIREAARTDMGFRSVSGSKRETVGEFKAPSEPQKSTFGSDVATGGVIQSKQSDSTGTTLPTDPESLEDRTWGTKAQSGFKYPPGGGR
ncbi:hypothetical protein FA15DRAFT_673388 [Coprinopsis marcescibilis]|uniref:DUF6533 domain-containing protein n=1 Tax=Coprinopsis marcescibilis TaxID=230819 RepID=A0A5C3KJY8_COPMA|nr:hypothetical protein FA15DRAFT_673388 [Coprinopsis marcescibilis]